ncbi:MAG: hypothetical protein JSW07_06065, partial [bacterium]
GEDGHEFDKMFCLQGEVPPQRYQGIHKNRGPQYIRGIMEGNGESSEKYMWNTYSMNKEDIWISRTRVPITGTVNKHIDEDFERTETESDLELWNLYIPKFAPIRIISSSKWDNNYLELRDEEPYDYALAERSFPESRIVIVRFRIQVSQVAIGSALEFEVQDQHGTRPMRLRFDKHWISLDREQVFPLTPIPLIMGKWYDVDLKLDCNLQSYDLAINGDWIRKDVTFAEKVNTLERLVFRTGPYRGDVRLIIIEKGEPRPAGLYSEDLPGADEKMPVSSFWIDDVRTIGQ